MDAWKIETISDVKELGDFLGKALKWSVTKKSTVKAKHKGTVFLVL